MAKQKSYISTPGKNLLKNKMGKVMHEYSHGLLHSGSKGGPIVTNRQQAIAIAYSEAKRRAAVRRRNK